MIGVKFPQNFLPHMMNGFHPLVSQWFLEAIGEPTSAQHAGRILRSYGSGEKL